MPRKPKSKPEPKPEPKHRLTKRDRERIVLHARTRDAALTSIRALANRCNYLHELVAVWPHARTALSIPEPTAPVVVDTIEARVAAIVTRPAQVTP